MIYVQRLGNIASFQSNFVPNAPFETMIHFKIKAIQEIFTCAEENSKYFLCLLFGIYR